MFFTDPIAPLPKVTAPTAAEICAQSNPSPQAKALLTPDQTPAEYFHALGQNKLPMDQVNFLSHGLPEKDSICWACQSARLNAPKLSPPELGALGNTEAWLKNPCPDLKCPIQASLGKVDFTGPASWSAQAAMWSGGGLAVPGVNLTAAAVAGAILLAAGLKMGAAMPAIPKPKLAIPNLPPTPEMLAQLKLPQVPKPAPPPLDQSILVKPLAPFLSLGEGVANGSITCDGASAKVSASA